MAGIRSVTVVSRPGLARASLKGRLRLALTSAAAVALVAAVAVSPASASTVTAPQPVPGTQALNAVACSTATACVALGFGDAGLLAVPITNGTPGAPVVVPVRQLSGVACPNATTCLIVGQQNVPRPGMRPTTQGVVVPISNGILGAPQGSPAVRGLDAIACTSATTCYAIGTAPGGVDQVVTITNGIPGAASPVADGIGLTTLACASATTCYGVGSTANGGVVVPIVNGIPGTPQDVLDAAFLDSVACSNATTCYATGTSADFSQNLLVPITNRVVGVPLFGTEFGAIACANATTCVTIGTNENGAGVVVPIVNGIPGTPLVIPGSTFLAGIACGGPTTCEGAGLNNDAVQVGVVVTIMVPPPCTTTVTGNQTGTLTTRPGLTCLQGVHLTGGIVVPRGASLDIENSSVTGSITAIGPNAVQICGTTIGGSVTVSGATGFVLVGDPGDDGCTSNNIAGSLVLRNNSHGLDAIGNHVKGAVTISGNSGSGPLPEDSAPEVSGNGR